MTGDAQARIDVYADEVMLGAVDVRDVVAAAIPEDAGLRPFEGRAEAAYCVAIDPLDGSSTNDVNASVGTIL